jgi:hypothetical protein
MVCFQTKNPNLGTFWRVLQWKILAYFMIIWSILRQYFRAIWYILWFFGIFFPILVFCTKENLATTEKSQFRFFLLRAFLHQGRNIYGDLFGRPKSHLTKWSFMFGPVVSHSWSLSSLPSNANDVSIFFTCIPCCYIRAYPLQ